MALGRNCSEAALRARHAGYARFIQLMGSGPEMHARCDSSTHDEFRSTSKMEELDRFLKPAQEWRRIRCFSSPFRVFPPPVRQIADRRRRGFMQRNSKCLFIQWEWEKEEAPAEGIESNNDSSVPLSCCSFDPGEGGMQSKPIHPSQFVPNRRKAPSRPRIPMVCRHLPLRPLLTPDRIKPDIGRRP